jgi:hypothetical protein
MEKRTITTGAASGNAYGTKTSGSAFFNLQSGNNAITGSLGTLSGYFRSAWL